MFHTLDCFVEEVSRRLPYSPEAVGGVTCTGPSHPLYIADLPLPTYIFQGPPLPSK